MNFINTQMHTKTIMQTTLKNKLLFDGVGIHNGRAVKMSIEPAKPNTGIVFERVDIDSNNLIKSNIDNVEDSELCTKITNDHGVSISTIEHLMTALNGLKIDNAIIKINSPELPAMDGSSEEYTRKIIKSMRLEEVTKLDSLLAQVVDINNEEYLYLVVNNASKETVLKKFQTVLKHGYVPNTNSSKQGDFELEHCLRVAIDSNAIDLMKYNGSSD